MESIMSIEKKIELRIKEAELGFFNTEETEEERYFDGRKEAYEDVLEMLKEKDTLYVGFDFGHKSDECAITVFRKGLDGKIKFVSTDKKEEDQPTPCTCGKNGSCKSWEVDWLKPEEEKKETLNAVDEYLNTLGIEVEKVAIVGLIEQHCQGHAYCLQIVLEPRPKEGSNVYESLIVDFISQERAEFWRSQLLKRQEELRKERMTLKPKDESSQWDPKRRHFLEAD